MSNTYFAKKAEITKEKLLIDAKDIVLGTLATRISHLLRGKHKVIYDGFQDSGDKVYVINANQIKVTGNKMEDKLYYKHTSYMGSLKVKTMSDITMSDALMKAVVRMMPKNKLSRDQMKCLHIFEDGNTGQNDKNFKKYNI